MHSFKAMSVLVVDDNEFLSRITAQICHAFGFGTVLTARSAEGALKTLTSADVDFVICDYQMAPTDGVDFARRIRAAKADYRFVPIIMLTAFTQLSKVIAARDAGVTEFVAKPVSPKALLDKLISVIDNPRPFVTDEHFVGPDRRRRKGEPRDVERRTGERGKE
jgi:CheY-like chemotaxis protein